MTNQGLFFFRDKDFLRAGYSLWRWRPHSSRVFFNPLEKQTIAPLDPNIIYFTDRRCRDALNVQWNTVICMCECRSNVISENGKLSTREFNLLGCEHRNISHLKHFPFYRLIVAHQIYSSIREEFIVRPEPFVSFQFMAIVEMAVKEKRMRLDNNSFSIVCDDGVSSHLLHLVCLLTEWISIPLFLFKSRHSSYHGLICSILRDWVFVCWQTIVTWIEKLMYLNSSGWCVRWYFVSVLCSPT